MATKKKGTKKKVTKKKATKKITDKELLNMVDESKLGKGANISKKGTKPKKKK